MKLSVLVAVMVIGVAVVVAWDVTVWVVAFLPADEATREAEINTAARMIAVATSALFLNRWAKCLDYKLFRGVLRFVEDCSP